MNKLTGTILTLPKMSGNVGAKTINIGGKGDDGATFTPSISADGIISWTNDKDLPNPEPVNIKGTKGDKGDRGDRGLQGVQGQPGMNGMNGVSPVVSVTDISGGHRITIQDAKGTKTVDVLDGAAGTDGKSAYQYAQDGGYTGTEEEFAEKLADDTPAVDADAVNKLIDSKQHAVTTYGAKGDGVTNDTKAFQDALAKNRIVTVPGGTYVLSDTLVIRENCCLELSQNTVLQFTQTAGNCIEMRGSAVLRGNHAVISAAFGLTGNVISMDTLQDGTNHASIPPYAKADPQWKRQRFVYDVNIIKPNSSGFNRPLADGVCRGTAIYMSATNLPTGTNNPDNADIPFLWGITLSGIRIAGGFSYGIHAVNYDTPAGSTGHYADDAWNHDMRIEAVIEGCEIGVCLDNCNGTHLNVTVQPTVSNPGSTKYAKQGVCLRGSRFVDMMRSRVWDWQVARTDSAEYQHLALYGNCRGLLLDDFLVHENPNVDIRDQIYTDTPSNFDSMTILQESTNKYFKSVDGVPYFNNGTTDRKLMLATDKFSAEQAEFIKPADGYYTYEPKFKNLVQGYTDGTYLAGSSTSTIADTYTTTDFIPIDGGNSHVYRIGGEGITWDDSYCYCRIAWYNADKSLKGSVMAWNKISSSIYYPEWVEDETVAAAFSTNANVAAPSGAAYFRITAKGKGANLIVTIDEPQEYNAIWHGEPKRLDESIHAKNDWNAAEGEVGHVLNRTHYEEVVTIFPETTITNTNQEAMYECNYPLQPGNTYTVFWNGNTYSCVALDFIDAVLIGNTGYIDYGENTGEPFLIGTMGNQLMIFAVDAQFTVSVVGKNIVTIPEKYLPKHMLIHTIEVRGNELTSTNGVVMMPLPYDSFITHLTSGGTVTIKFIFNGEDGTEYTQVANITNYVWTYVDDNNGDGPVPVVFAYCPMFMSGSFRNYESTLRFNGTIPPPTT